MVPEELAELYRAALRLTESQGLAIAHEDWDRLEHLLAERQSLLDRAAPFLERIMPGDPALEPARVALRSLLAREATNQAALEAQQDRLEHHRASMSRGAGALARYRVTTHEDEASWYIDDAR